MAPVFGLFATAVVVGAGAALGWRLARRYLPLRFAGAAAATGAAPRPRVIDADYVEVTGPPADSPRAAKPADPSQDRR